MTLREAYDIIDSFVPPGLAWCLEAKLWHYHGNDGSGPTVQFWCWADDPDRDLAVSVETLEQAVAAFQATFDLASQGDVPEME